MDPDTIVDRILAAAARASAAEHGRGSESALWYPREAKRLTAIAETLEVEPARAIMIAAALAPRVTWERAVWGVPLALTNGTTNPGFLSRSWALALELVENDDPSLDRLPGPKTRDFAGVLLGSLDVAVIDVWADRAAGSPFPRLTPRRYSIIQGCYHEAAEILGESPSMLQARTWCWARETL